MNFESKKLILLSTLLLAVIYVVVGFKFGFIQNIASTVFSTPDSNSYRKTSDCIFNRKVEPCPINKRPYLFPLLISVRYLFGNTSIVFLNFTFWIIGYYFLASAISILTIRKIPIIVTALLFGSNISMFAITFHALSETLLLFLTALLIYLLVLTTKKGLICTAGNVLVVLSLMAVTKPGFIIHYLVTAFIVVILFLYKKEPLRIIIKTMFVSVLIVATQFVLVFINTATVSFSSISEITLRNYLYSQTYSEEHNISYDEARGVVESIPVASMLKYLIAHPAKTISQYSKNIIGENLVQGSSFVRKGVLRTISLDTNRFYIATYLFLIVVTGLLFLLKNYKATKFLILTCALLTTITILESGISFSQGDRLVMGNIPIFIFFLSWDTHELEENRARISKYGHKTTGLLRN